MNKKILSLLITAVVIPTVLSGCSSYKLVKVDTATQQKQSTNKVNTSKSNSNQTSSNVNGRNIVSNNSTNSQSNLDTTSAQKDSQSSNTTDYLKFDTSTNDGIVTDTNDMLSALVRGDVEGYTAYFGQTTDSEKQSVQSLCDQAKKAGITEIKVNRYKVLKKTDTLETIQIEIERTYSDGKTQIGHQKLTWEKSDILWNVTGVQNID